MAGVERFIHHSAPAAQGHRSFAPLSLQLSQMPAPAPQLAGHFAVPGKCQRG